MFVQPWNSSPEEVKTTKQDYVHKCNGRPCCEEKKRCKIIINITILKTTENIYHVTRQNLHFAHTPYNKNKN